MKNDKTWFVFSEDDSGSSVINVHEMERRDRPGHHEDGDGSEDWADSVLWKQRHAQRCGACQEGGDKRTSDG